MSIDYAPAFVGNPLHKRRMTNRAVDWVSGEFPSSKAAMNFRMVRWDGTLSRSLVLLMESDPEVETYWEKPESFRWTDGRRWRTYTPDFAVGLTSGRWIAVEVRPRKRIAKTGFLPKVPFIREAAVEAGYEDFELWTDEEIEIQPGLVIADILAAHRRFTVDPDAEHRMRLTIRELGGRACIGDLRRKSRIGRQAFRTVLRLVAIGELRMVRNDVILDDHAVVAIPQR